MRVVSISFLYPEAIPVPVAVASASPALVRRSGGAPLGASVFAGAADETRSLRWYADIVDERGECVQSEGLVPAAGSGAFRDPVPRGDRLRRPCRLQRRTAELDEPGSRAWHRT